MTRFWWVRHGPTHQRAFTGWRDVPADLSDHDRIARLHAYLPQGALLISSDLTRAKATAAALGTGRDTLPESPALREFNFGDWDGKTFAEVAASHPEQSRAYWEQPGVIAPPNGESWNALAERVTGQVQSLLVTHKGCDIIAVAHIGVILTQVRLALNISPYQALSHHIEPLSVSQLTHDGTHWQAGVINHCP